MTTISLIVSSCNQLELLKKSLSSATSQQPEYDQIIVIDDASTDGSQDYLETWASTSDNRVYFGFDENQGRSGSKNKGLDLATGDYIAFLDGDDWLESGATRELHRLVSIDAPDICIAGTQFYLDATGQIQHLPDRHPYFSEIGLANEHPETDAEICPLLRLLPTHWSKLHKRDFLLDHNFRFSSLIYEDISWHYQCLILASSIRCTKQTLMNYRLHPDSILSTTSEEHFGIFDAFERAIGFAESKLGYSSEITRMGRKHRFNTFFYILFGTQRIPSDLRVSFARKSLSVPNLTDFELTTEEANDFSRLKQLADS